MMADSKENAVEALKATTKDFEFTEKERAKFEEIAERENMPVEALFAKLVTDAIRDEN